MKRYNSYLMAATAGVATVVSLNSCKTEREAEKQYNIIHIMTDDHSWQAISAYGHPISQMVSTPNIDRIAQKGMLFTQGCVENSISAPSRATLLTGLYSHKHGQKTLTKGFKEDNVVFPELLQQAGYQTAIVGKWHLKTEPRGFDYYKILEDQGEYYNPEFRTKETSGEYIREEGYATTLITDHAIEWLDHRDSSKPFCLLVHHKAPHRNWMPEEKYLELYEELEFPYPETFFDDYSTRGEAAKSQEMKIADFMTLRYDLKVNEIAKEPNDAQEKWSLNGWEASRSRMTPSQIAAWDAAYKPKNEAFLKENLKGDELTKWKYQRYMKDYMRTIKSVDEQIGRLLDYLETNGMMENTLIVYTSDQGFYMGEHGWFDKRFMYSESMRTPILAMCSGKIPAGVVCDALVQNIDFAPTYLDFAGVTPPVEIDGLSLKEVMATNKIPQDWRKSLYYHYYDYPAIHAVRRHDGVYDGRYKLIHFYGKGEGKDAGHDLDYYEFFDLKTDPNEIKNVYGKPEYETEIKRLTNELNSYRKDLNVPE